MTNFTTEDLLGSVRATGVFAAVLFCPGYLLLAVGNRLGFGRPGAWARAAWAVGLSFAAAPLAGYLAARVASVGVCAWLFGACAAAALALAAARVFAARVFAGERAPRTRLDRTGRTLLALLPLGMVLVLLELVDIQLGARLYQSVSALDMGYRVTFIDSIARAGVPPPNPLYAPGHTAPLRYYFFWYVLCAVVTRLGRVSARQALMASSAWAGAGLAAMVALFARYFLRLGAGTRRFALTGSLLLGVTGLDLLPVLVNHVMGQPFLGDMEWWSVDQVSSWLDTVLWVPNHLASLLACLPAFLLLWLAHRPGRTRVQSALLAALAAWSAAGAFGESIYVGFGFLLLMLAWTVAAGFGWFGLGPFASSATERTPDWPFIRRNLAAIGLSGLLLVPFVASLLVAKSATESGAGAGAAHLFTFGIRRMIDPAVVPLPWWSRGIEQAQPHWVRTSVELLLLFPGYLVELGCLALVLLFAWKRRRALDLPRRTALFFAITGLLLVTFLRSSVISNNDFGYRAAMIPCFFLVLLETSFLPALLGPRAAPHLPVHAGAAVETDAHGDAGPVWRAIFIALLVIGVAGTAFQGAALRLFQPAEAAAGREQFGGLPHLLFAVRTTLSRAAPSLPRGAVVQADPTDAGDYLALADMLYSGRRMAIAPTRDCGAAFGGDASQCMSARTELQELYAAPTPSASQVLSVCAHLQIDYLLATSRDPAWNERAGWIWTLPLVAPANQGTDRSEVRLLACRPRVDTERAASPG